MEPTSGQAGIEITISGEHFESSVEYSIYWDPPTVLIGDRSATDFGQISPFTYTVPITAALGAHQITAEHEGAVVGETSFEVIE